MNKSILCSIVLFLVVMASSIMTQDIPLSPIVTLPNLGQLQGSVTTSDRTQRTIYQYLGIRYAESPDGARRFKPPIAALPWNNVMDVTRYGRQCPVYSNIVDYTPEQLAENLEDCLSLSVYSNDLTTIKPVMVYIHGGGFYDGGSLHHPPHYMLEKDIVMVVPQYRLGPLGFLSTKSLTIPGNAGLFDVLLALDWVQQHISHFGGDANQVTLYGQSAGAAIVSALSYSPIVPHNLFHKVILQSGSSLGTWVWDEQPERNAREILRYAGFSHTAPLVEVETQFINMDVLTLLTAFTLHSAIGSASGVNTVGGHRFTIGGPSRFLPHNPYQLIKTGNIRRDLPMMAGVTKQDGTFTLANIYDMLLVTSGVNDFEFNSFRMVDYFNDILGMNDITGAYYSLAVSKLFTQEQLVQGEFNDMVEGYADLCSISMLKGPVLRAVQANAQFNPNETFLYTFDYAGEHTRFGYGADTSHYPFSGGVHHSNDNIYIYPWPAHVSILNEADTEMSMKMVDLWTSFAISGVPSTPGQPEWLPFNRVTGPYMHINTQMSIGQNFLDEMDVTVREDTLRKVAVTKPTNKSSRYMKLFAKYKHFFSENNN